MDILRNRLFQRGITDVGMKTNDWNKLERLGQMRQNIDLSVWH